MQKGCDLAILFSSTRSVVYKIIQGDEHGAENFLRARSRVREALYFGCAMLFPKVRVKSELLWSYTSFTESEVSLVLSAGSADRLFAKVV